MFSMFSAADVLYVEILMFSVLSAVDLCMWESKCLMLSAADLLYVGI